MWVFMTSSGVNTPRRGAKLAPFVPMPPTMRRSILEMMMIGKNPCWTQLAYNDASLRVASIQPIIQAGQLKGYKNDSSVRLSTAVTVIKYSVYDVPVTSTEKGTMVIQIHVFDQFHDSYEALAFELSKYERDISSVVRPLTPVSMVSPADSGFRLASEALANLDVHLAKHVVSRSQIRRPDLQLVEYPSQSVGPGKPFDIRFLDTDYLDPSTYAYSSKGSLVIPAGPRDDGYTQRFFVMEPEYPPESLTVTVAGAHYDTLHPGFVSFDMVVKGS